MSPPTRGIYRIVWPCLITIGVLILAIWGSQHSTRSPGAPAAPTPPASGVQYVKLQSPCALDSDTKRPIARAILDKDIEALQGLVERGKAIVLEPGVRFEAQPDSGGFAWGFVRSGRQVGRDCYIPQAFLQDQPPAGEK